MGRYDLIPADLKAQMAWVNVRNGSKVPMQTTCFRGASSVLPDTWGSFDTAVENVEQGIYDGIGYVFHDDGYIGIDIDTAKDADGFLNEMTIDIICRCKSYTELSRSHRGVHIILKGDLPFKGRNNRDGIEIYRTSRYFICTGERLYFADIVENQEAIDYIVDKYFADAPRESAASTPPRIYSPSYSRPVEGKVRLRPDYTPITNGCRNISLTSLAGQLHTQGYNRDAIREELLYCNSVACTPPLPQSEINLIVRSVCKYAR